METSVKDVTFFYNGELVENVRREIDSSYYHARTTGSKKKKGTAYAKSSKPMTVVAASLNHLCIASRKNSYL
jgi:hypothetical protein